MDPMNRRISIIVMNKKTEMAVLSGAGNNLKEKSSVAVSDQPAATSTPTEQPNTVK
jgi:hypothetical protein